MRQWGSLPSLGGCVTIPNEKYEWTDSEWQCLTRHYFHTTQFQYTKTYRSIDNELSLGKLFDIIGKVRESVSV